MHKKSPSQSLFHLLKKADFPSQVLNYSASDKKILNTHCQLQYKKPCTSGPSITLNSLNIVFFCSHCYLFGLAVAIYIKKLPPGRTSDLFVYWLIHSSSLSFSNEGYSQASRCLFSSYSSYFPWPLRNVKIIKLWQLFLEERFILKGQPEVYC